MCLRQWWEQGKAETKDFCHQCTFNVSSDLAKSMRDLETEIVELQIPQETEVVLRTSILKKLCWLTCWALEHRVHRFQNLSLMDAPTKFLFLLEKKKERTEQVHTWFEIICWGSFDSGW